MFLPLFILLFFITSAILARASRDKCERHELDINDLIIFSLTSSPLELVDTATSYKKKCLDEILVAEKSTSLAGLATQKRASTPIILLCACKRKVF